jgi:hypothetical protein
MRRQEARFRYRYKTTQFGQEIIMNKLTHTFAFAVAVSLTMSAATSIARGGDHPSGITNFPTTVAKAKVKPSAVNKPTSIRRPTAPSPAPRRDGGYLSNE